MNDRSKAGRLKRLDRIAAALEKKILEGRGDVNAMRIEWRRCQNEMLAIEGEPHSTGDQS